MLPSRSLPPLECCLGTSPIQAEKLRPDRKVLGSATLATRAVANIGPTPGTGACRQYLSASARVDPARLARYATTSVSLGVRYSPENRGRRVVQTTPSSPRNPAH